MCRQTYKSAAQEAAEEAYAQASNNWPKPYEKMSDFLVRDKKERAQRFLDDINNSQVKQSYFLEKIRQHSAMSGRSLL